MPSFCSVTICGNKYVRGGDKSFFRLPSVVTKYGPARERLSRARRSQWLTIIGQKDLNPSKEHSVRVCSDHFISREPAKMYDVDHPDWAPSQNLEHSNNVSRKGGGPHGRHKNNQERKEKGKVTKDLTNPSCQTGKRDSNPLSPDFVPPIFKHFTTQEKQLGIRATKDFERRRMTKRKRREAESREKVAEASNDTTLKTEDRAAAQGENSCTKLSEAENDDQKSCNAAPILLSHQAEEMSFWCVVPGCNGNYPSGPKVAVFSFPKDKELMEAWVKVISEFDFTPNNSSKVCEQHFQAEDLVKEAFVPQLKTGTNVKVSLHRPYLRYGAVPSMLLNQTSKKSSGSHSGKPVKTVQRLEGSDLDVPWASSSYKKDSRLFFKNQHTDHWIEFHYKTPVLSCMGRFNAVQRIQTSSNLPSFASSSSSTNTSNTTPCSNTSCVEEEEEDFVHPASLLVPSKTKQLMRLLQKYRHTNPLLSNSSKKQESPSRKERRESPPVSVEDMTQIPSLPTISSEESQMRLLLNPMTVNVKDVTYISVFSSHQENAISKYIMGAKPVKKNGKKKPLAREDICKLVYHFCVSYNIPRPTLWNVHQAADMEWCKGFLRRYPCHEYDPFFSDDEDEENDFEGFEDRPNQLILQAEPCSELDGDRLIQIKGLKWDHSYAVVSDLNK